MATTPNSITFYVYALARPIKKDWKIFYIGKGSKRRVFGHEAEARRGHTCYKCNVIRKVWREGGEIQRYILLTTDDEQEAFAYEREMIALHGRENLCNQTDGGEGISGHKMSDDAKRKTGEGVKRYYANPDRRAQAADYGRLGWRDPQNRKKRVMGIRQQRNTPESRARQREITKSAWADPQKRAKMAEAIKARITPESRADRSRRTKGLWDDPTYREKTRQAIKAAKSTPEARAKKSEQTKVLWEKNREQWIAQRLLRASLTLKQGEEICRLWATGNYLQRELASMFSICTRTLRQVIRGTQTVWKSEPTDDEQQ